MTREEMLKKLGSVPFCAVPTEDTMDMGMQFDYVTPQGCGTGFGVFGEWPAHRLNGMDPEKWQNIRKKTADHTLTAEDLRGTDLELILDNMLEGHDEEEAAEVEEDLWAFFDSLLDLPDALPDPFYCLYDEMDTENPFFFEDRDSCIEAFQDMYCDEIEDWEDMDDDTLMEWMDIIEDEMKEFPFTRIGETDDESIE